MSAEIAALLQSLLQARQDSPTLASCLSGYLASQEFQGLSAATKPAIRRVLLRWLDLVRSLDPIPLGSRNTYFRRIRVLLRWAIARGYRPDDPTTGLHFKPINLPRHEWTADDLARYRAHWPIGHRARLILELTLATAQRRGDITRFRWDHLTQEDGAIWLSLTQRKTKTPLAIPLHADAIACLRAVAPHLRRGHIVARKASQRGLSAGGLGALFERFASQAGCAGRLHGLRRYACTRLAEAGATPHQIAAVSGHKSLSEVARYTKAAHQRQLAAAALSLLSDV
jgi:integrase